MSPWTFNNPTTEFLKVKEFHSQFSAKTAPRGKFCRRFPPMMMMTLSGRSLLPQITF
jgi:hypothetical protein